jgi:hypothetical protein
MQIKKVAVELFVEKRDMDHMELIMNNALALALNSKSSECVQVCTCTASLTQSLSLSHLLLKGIAPEVFPLTCVV